MAAAGAESSGAAEAFEQAAVGGDDAGDVFRPRLGQPFVPLESAAEDDAVGAGEHVTGFPCEGILNLRTGQPDGELAAGGLQVSGRVTVAGATAGASSGTRQEG